MAQQEPGPNAGTDPSTLLENVDFDAFYQGKPPIEGIDASFTTTPWDIGGPQPALVETERRGLVTSEVLDVGCGLGDNALFLAERGYQVTGVDASPTALESARERAHSRGVSVTFQVGDATRLDGFDGRFRTAVDSALYHCLGAQQRHDYVAAVHRACAPGAVLHLFCAADAGPTMFPASFVVGEQELRQTVGGGGWAIRELEIVRYTTALTPDSLQEVMPALATLGGSETAASPESLTTDDQGRLTFPVWHLVADRA